ncbi:hypothetical protein MNBD_NITROSPINAE04-1315 [hydrothermal vent metagenome]|uniref:Glycosyl transferase family 1 domain-containing protein n=1 Tax=hydrothermal vent metagenome TaxID=652676 RepID=A0A3B1BFY3_9ZZZZ
MSETGRIKLAHISRRPYVAGGGMERMDYYLYKYLSREYFDPRFVILNDIQPGDVPYDDSVDYIYLDKINRFDQLIKLLQDVDVVSYSAVDRFQPLICEAARLSKTPSLVEIMVTKMPGQLYDHIDLTVCVSKTVRNEQPDKEKTVVIYNGVDRDEFSYKRKKRDGGKIVLLQVCRREKEMFFHLDELADQIFAITPDVELWLAGRGQTGDRSGKVKFYGLAPDIAKLDTQADLFVLLSKTEGLPLAVMEAMACGSVPIVSDEPSLAEVVTDGVDGFVVNAESQSEVVSKIKLAVEMAQSGAIDKMRKAARKTIEEKFDIRKTVREYEKVFAEIVDKKGRRQQPGPATAEPTPEVDIYEALDHYHAERWDDAVHCFTNMTERSSPLTIDTYFSVTENFILLCETNGLADLSDALIKKLYESGYRQESFINFWRAISLARPSRFTADSVLNHSQVNQDPKPDTYMRSALLLLREGLKEHGASVLSKGMKRWPDMKEFKELYKNLSKKLKL